MIVFVNNKEIRIFEGARVRDAVLAYSNDSYSDLLHERIRVVDRFGNITEPDGELSEGQSVFIKSKKESL